MKQCPKCGSTNIVVYTEDGKIKVYCNTCGYSE